MSISKKRLDEIRNFEDNDISDMPELTDEQLAKMKPCHLVGKNVWKNEDEMNEINYSSVLSVGQSSVVR